MESNIEEVAAHCVLGIACNRNAPDGARKRCSDVMVDYLRTLAPAKALSIFERSDDPPPELAEAAARSSSSAQL
jgi:hypothetical protein